MNKIMTSWTIENPLGLNPDILTMKAYAPYHLLFAISGVFAKCNNQKNVPSPAECLRLAQDYGLVESIINIAVNCLNNAIEIANEKYIAENKTFIPQNWVKSKACIQEIQSAIINYFSFLPTMNKNMADRLSNNLKMEPQHFSYRVQADD